MRQLVRTIGLPHAACQMLRLLHLQLLVPAAALRQQRSRRHDGLPGQDARCNVRQHVVHQSQGGQPDMLAGSLDAAVGKRLRRACRSHTRLGMSKAQVKRHKVNTSTCRSP